MALARPATAQLQWDPGLTPATPSGGSGSWTNLAANWSDGTNNVAWNNLIANFGGAAGTVTVGSPGMSVTGITVNTDAYIITGVVANALTIGANTPIVVGSGFTTTFSNFFTGTGGNINFNSPGGTGLFSVANTNTGGFTLTAGTVRITNATFAGTSAGTLTLAGGSLLNGDGTNRTIANPLAITGDVTIGTVSTGTNGSLNFSSPLNATTGDRIITLQRGTGAVANVFISSGLFTLGGNLTINETGGATAPAFTGGIVSIADRTMTFNNTGANAVIRGPSDFSGTSVLTLAGSAPLQIGSTSGPTSGTFAGGIIVNGVTLSFNAANTFTTLGYRVDAGQITIPGTVSNMPAAPITVRGGALRPASTLTDSIHNITLDGINLTPITLGSATAGTGMTLAAPNISIINNPTINVATGGFTINSSLPTVLNGNLAFGNSGTGTATFTSDIDFGGIARTITTNRSASGNATVFNGNALNLVSGTTVNVLGGTVTVGNSNAIGSGLTAVNVAGGTVASVFTLAGTGNTVTLASLTLGGTGTTTHTVNIGANTLIVNSDIVYDITGNPGTGAAAINGTAGSPGLSIGAITKIFNIADSTASGVDLAVAAPITGSAGLIKNGLGGLSLGGNNSTTLTGTINVNSGRLIIAGDGALGDIASGTVVADGATLSTPVAAVTYTLLEPITINGNGAAGRLGALDQQNTTGTVPVFPAPITLGSNSSIGNNSGAVFNLGSPINAAGFELTFNNTNTITFTGTIANGTRVIKTGTINFNWNSTGNNFSELVILNGSSSGNAITIQTSNPFPATATLTLTPVITGTLALALGTNTLTLAGINFGGIAGAQPRISSGTGAVLTLNGNVVYDTTNNPAQAQFSIVDAGGTLDLGNTPRTFTIGESTAVPLNSAELLINWAVASGPSGGIIKAGDGQLTLNAALGNPGFEGSIAINAGRLVANQDNVLGTTTVGTLVNNGGTLGIGGLTYTAAEPVTINGPGAALRGGAIDLNSTTGSFAGPVTLGSASTIGNVSSTVNSRLTLTGNVDTAGFLLTVNAQPAGTSGGVTLAGVISGSGGLTKTGTQGLTLGGGIADTNPNNFTGDLTFSEGRLALSKADNTIVVPGNFFFNGGTLSAQATSNQFAPTTNIIQTAGTFDGNGAGVSQTVNNFTQTGGIWQNGSGSWNFNIVTTTNAQFTVNSGSTITAASVSYNGAAGNYVVAGNNASVRTIYTLGALAVNDTTLNTAGFGSSSTAGSTLVLNGNISSTGTATITRTVTDTNHVSGLTGALDFNGGTRTITVAGTLTINSPVHNGSLVKEGAGRLNLNAAAVVATPIVNLSVNNGSLYIGDTAPSAASIGPGVSPVLVAASATLGGHGIIERGTFLAGTLAPGGSIGTLTTTAGNTVWGPGATYALEVNTTAVLPVAGMDNDHFLGSGTATLDLSTLSTSNKFNVNVIGDFNTPSGLPQDWTIATFPAAGIIAPTGIVGNDLTPFFNITGNYTGAATATLVGGNAVVLNFTATAIPEPTLILGIAACGGLLLRRRK